MNRPPMEWIEGESVEALLARVKMSLPEDYETIQGMADLIRWLLEFVRKKKTSISRLRKMLFGPTTEKSSDVLQGEESEGAEKHLEAEDAGGTAEAAPVEASPRRGHGRRPEEDYVSAKRFSHPHESLKPGTVCPCCGKGKVYDFAAGTLVIFRGRTPIEGEIHQPQKMRCNACGEVFTAKLPEDVTHEKYDPTAGSMIALMKYGCGFALHRLAKLQENLGIPLSASTMWDVLARVARLAHPVVEELLRLAAQGDVLFTDDTAMKILGLIKLMDKRRKDPEDDDTEDDDDEEEASKKRTGIFTTTVVSEVEGRRIALFFTGRNHAGENMDRVLALRDPNRGPPMEMCDGLSRNRPQKAKVTLLNCLTHGRRKFVEVLESFPRECHFVIECLRAVYLQDGQAKRLGLSPEERLRFHQERSAPIVAALEIWFAWKMEARLVEPNSELGKAIKYMQKRWAELTRFLHLIGAPLDNNLAERVLKIVLLHRKNSLFYLTENGASVGDCFMTLIHTCRLAGVDAFRYLTALQRHAERVREHPRDWLPWNYEGTVAQLEAAKAAS